MKSIQEILAEIKTRIDELTPADVAVLRETNAESEIAIIDVRDKDEVEDGKIPGSIHLPKSFVELRIENTVSDRSRKVVLYCAGGTRSLLAADALHQLGYTDVVSMSGGFSRWKNEGHAIEKPRFLSPADEKRYKRHLTMPEVGADGQLKLLDAKVLLIGAGGIGSPAAYYLAAAGVGQLGIVDFDDIDESNLQRQILHTFERVGTPKVESAKKTLLALNPSIRIESISERLDSSNVEEIFSGYDIVLDGSDNFPTRYLINDACVKLGIPNVHGSVYRFEGQVTVFAPPKGPCYRCLYPEPPPPEMAPSCAEAGVLGVLPGVVGLLEAIEVIKLILEIGDPLIGKLLHYDALQSEFRTLKLRKDPQCAYCAEGKEFPGFIDYAFFCANPSAG